ALGDVAGVVLGVHFPDRRPAADIVPAGGKRHYAGAAGLLHHRVVDGVVRAAGEGGRVDGDLRVLALAAFQRQQAGVVDVHVVVLELFQEAAGAEQEHAAVPVVVAALHVLGGTLGVGLLDEVGDARDTIGQGAVGLAADVAVTGFRTVGGHAEQHHLAFFRCHGGQR